MRKILWIIVCLLVTLSSAYLIYYFYQNYYKTTLQPPTKTSKKTSVSLNKEKEPLTFKIAGDAMLGRGVAEKFDDNLAEAFAPLGENFFGKFDLGILNLEGPISQENVAQSQDPENLVFNFPRNSIDALKYLKINAASLANNHSQNQGKAGLETTRKLLEENNIQPIGSQTSFDENNLARFKSADGLSQLSVITINSLEVSTDIRDTIRQEKASKNFVLIFPHWGNEYQSTHNQTQEELAHSWIDDGADLVIGSHPHVVQDAEIYQQKPIFYSLGNLIFDQTFSAPTQRGLILSGQISAGIIKIKIVPTVIEKFQVNLAQYEEKQNVLDGFKEDFGDQVLWNEDEITIKI